VRANPSDATPPAPALQKRDDPPEEGAFRRRIDAGIVTRKTGTDFSRGTSFLEMEVLKRFRRLAVEGGGADGVVAGGGELGASNEPRSTDCACNRRYARSCVPTSSVAWTNRQNARWEKIVWAFRENERSDRASRAR
jgi:hypothetical protein